MLISLSFGEKAMDGQERKGEGGGDSNRLVCSCKGAVLSLSLGEGSGFLHCLGGLGLNCSEEVGTAVECLGLSDC